MPKEICIEPMFGATYGPSFEGERGVYEYDTYERGSVLEGRRRRTFLDSGTLEEMQEKYPNATVTESTGYVEDNFMYLSDSEEPDDFDENYDDDY